MVETKTVKESEEKTVEEKSQTIEIPARSKFILIFEAPDSPIGLKSGGFTNLDEMLGFNRRCVNSNMTEQMIFQGVQKEMEKQQKK